ncbi:2-hydroxyacid dehydrogenase [Novosphingobium flavum]|uniref:2-hydroxyacid dehydrogenase n=1 Tax=Novosphingobium aerophilum TaxID=2839843 RepID=A0A7X1KBZ3_9SPHN|nr:NAD(P)-dependent oxidoreductase [Novosphingobium aerophilum]MBC2651665.1 2-hydroxyacid dehydrogenase [Novosphingobium aerophilum]MBC2661423.1 2-hydroxyacid dehydrogenase [Novosphingobium aerophilum]
MAADRVLVTHPFLRMMLPLDPALHPIDVLPEDPAEREAWLAAHGDGVRAMITSGLEPVPAALLALLPNLELISSVAAGLDLIDVATARARGIAVTNGGGLNSPDVAEFAVAQLLARRRDLAAADAWVRAGQWPTGRMPPSGSVSAERVGIVGLGEIGRGVAERLAPFGSAIRWWGPRAKPNAPWAYEPDLQALAEWASTLVIAVAGTEETRGLVNREVLAALGPSGVLINVARGFVVDEEALKDLLRAGQLGGAALDVVCNEPDDGTAWADVPNVTLSPHVAGATRESLARMMGGAADNVRRLFMGEALVRRVV